MSTLMAVLIAVLNSLWQAVLLAGLVWLALRFAHNMNAATRFAIWWSVLGAVLVFPAAPHIVASLREWLTPATIQSARPLYAPSPAPAQVLDLPPLVTVAEPNAASWPLWVAVFWALMLVYRLTQLTRSYVYLRGLKRRASMSNETLMPSGRTAHLLFSSEIESPIAVGFSRPSVILPHSLPAQLSREEMDHVLLHETAHLARWDDWTTLLARLLGASLVLHPVAGWILRRIEIERELACDEWVVSHTQSVRPYARSLARLYELRFSDQAAALLASGIFGSGSRLSQRIEVLLARGRKFTARVSIMRVGASCCALLALTAVASFLPRWIALAQTQRAKFDVASVKPSDPNDRRTMFGTPPNGSRFRAAGVNLRMLIGFAYDKQLAQISGGPNWLESDRFEIDARPENAVPGLEGLQQIRSMLQSLLEDRFKLTVHSETRLEPVYELVLAKGGSKLKETSANDGAPRQQMGRGQVIASATPLSQLIPLLSVLVQRQVIDKTGLTGMYDFTLTYTLEPGQLGALGPDVPPPVDPTAPSVFTALQEQLGLKLESARGRAQVLVIDHAEKPDAN